MFKNIFGCSLLGICAIILQINYDIWVVKGFAHSKGIDPGGYAIVGYGVIGIGRPISAGGIQGGHHGGGRGFIPRLAEIYDGMQGLLNRLKPEAAAVEKLYFFSNNKTTGIGVAEARVILLAVPGRRSTVRIYAHAGQAGSDGLRESAEAPNAGNDAKAAPTPPGTEAGRYGGRAGAGDLSRSGGRFHSAPGAPAARVPGQVI